MKKSNYSSKKFALIGTSCVGKTTLLSDLKKILGKKYKNKIIVTVPEAARFFFEKRKVRNPFSYINQIQIQSLANEFEKKAEAQKPHIIICDRSVLDAAAYVRMMGTMNDAEKLIRRAKKWFTTYSHFFLLDPKGIPYKTDPIRKEDLKVREGFHKSFLILLENLTLPYTLISGNKEERIYRVTSIISKFYS